MIKMEESGRTARQIAADAKLTGGVWLGGKLEFPFGATFDETSDRLLEIAYRSGGRILADPEQLILRVYPKKSERRYYILAWECRSGPGPTVITHVTTDEVDMRERRKADGSYDIIPINEVIRNNGERYGWKVENKDDRINPTSP